MILAMASAFEAGFIDNSHFPTLIAIGPRLTPRDRFKGGAAGPTHEAIILPGGGRHIDRRVLMRGRSRFGRCIRGVTCANRQPRRH